ncbi:hypothetical protein RI129_006344 [Pyrocoelia pectoralis]|uniref:Potassium channel domain-containing protein n=1 Tax=Pyrocoelia pectoralis TaxID=417401 RepID=A0AAN7VJM7_9COLE
METSEISDLPPPLPPRMPINQISLILPNHNNFKQEAEYTTNKPETKRSKPIMSKKRAYRYTRKQLAVVKGGIKGIAQTGLSFGEKFTYGLYNKFSEWSHRWFTHCFLTFILILYTVGGALMFVAIEGSKEKVKEEFLSEDKAMVNLKIGRHEFMRDLKNYSKILLDKADEEWDLKVIKKLQDYETFIVDVYQNFTIFTSSRNDPISWTFFNAIVFCGTLYTTIGYGHMFPTTTIGMAVTIVYALIGIPLFLITLTDFGKLFTRAIKFLWTFVRRLYYTGSCRKVRKKAHIAEIIQGAQAVYGVALVGKRAIFSGNNDPENSKSKLNNEKEPKTFEIDDEFNLPISVAIIILVVYIFLGAIMYWIWERWDFFTAFYFVFISLSTIGFGDYVPKDPFCMIMSIAYLVFGLALMSMCINVVQLKLTETFSQASAKLRATMEKNRDQCDDVEPEIPCSLIEDPDVQESLDTDEDGEEDNLRDTNATSEN